MYKSGGSAKGGEMSNLRRLQLQVAEKMRREYLRNPRPSRVNTIWVTLFEFLLDDVREGEEALHKLCDNIWRDTEEYLSKLDTFIRDLTNFSMSEEACQEEVKRRKEDIQKDLENLQKKINERSDILDVMSDNLQGLQKTREELLRIRQTPEFAVLKNWMKITCDKCVEMENEITDIKLRISEKNADILESLGHGHIIFSKVNIEDLKKLPPFKTDQEPPSSNDRRKKHEYFKKVFK